MNLSFIWEALLVLSVGFVLLRFYGKKAVGQMTGLEVVTLLATASMIGHAVAGKGPWQTIAVLCTFAALLMTVQWVAVKFDWAERIMMGRAITIVEDGKFVVRNLRRLRMTVDQAEAKLREKGIVSVADVKTATLEVGGVLGYELVPDAKPVTVRDLQRMLADVVQRHVPTAPKPSADGNLFVEVREKEHSRDVPSRLN